MELFFLWTERARVFLLSCCFVLLHSVAKATYYVNMHPATADECYALSGWSIFFSFRTVSGISVLLSRSPNRAQEY